MLLSRDLLKHAGWPVPLAAVCTAVVQICGRAHGEGDQDWKTTGIYNSAYFSDRSLSVSAYTQEKKRGKKCYVTVKRSSLSTRMDEK